MKKLLFVLTLLCCSCGPFPFSPNPVVRVVYRRPPRIGRTGGMGFPMALEVYNPNPFGVLADIDCTYTHYRWEFIGSHEEKRFPIVLGDGFCDVNFNR